VILRRNIESLAKAQKAKQPQQALKEIEEKVEEIGEKACSAIPPGQLKRTSSVIKVRERVTVTTLNAEGDHSPGRVRRRGSDRKSV
jgi:hypothetical protein